MKNITLKEFKEFLDVNKIPYKYENRNGVDLVYAYGEKEKLIDPFDHKTVHEFTPYLRVSHFGERDGYLYTRDCGWCEWQTVDWILNKVKEFKKEEKKGEEKC